MANMRQIAKLAGVSVATVSKAFQDHSDIGANTRERVREIARQLNYTVSTASPARGASGQRQIAKLAGVSVATVSKALRDHPDIGESTRAKVKEIARQLGYTLPDTPATNGAAGRMLGYLIHDWFAEMATAILRGATDEARNTRHGIMLVQANQSLGWIEESINNLLDFGINGLIIAHSFPETLPRRILLAIRSKGIHVVQVMNRVFGEPIDSVCRNEAEYARVVVEHLAALGHRTLLGFNMISPRFQVWNYTCRAAGMGFIDIDSRIMEKQVDIPEETSIFEAILRMTPRPTAIMIQRDFDADRIMRQAHQHGLRVPEDLSIICMGDIYRASVYPEITMIDMQSYQMGCLGARLLIERIIAGIPPHEITNFQDMLLPVELIDHGSTGLAPSL